MRNSAGIISVAPEPDAQEEPIEPGPDSEHRCVAVPVEQHGWRLDRAIASALPEFSRSYLQQLIAEGLVLLRGQTALKPALRVRAGDAVDVTLRPTPWSRAFVAQPMDLDIVFRDPHLLVLNKPAGLVVHPAPGHWSGTLLNGLLALGDTFAEVPRAGIVHRLDKDTSGLMLVACSRQAMDSLVGMIAARTVQRAYLALAQGRWKGPAEREVEAPIGRDPSNRLRMAVVDLRTQGGKPARTSFQLMAQADTECLLWCRLHTGRTHQIRVHAQAIGHPLLGDVLYGGRAVDGMQRQALHAVRLELPHPITGEPLRFDAPVPPDLHDALALRGLQYNRR